MAEEIEIIVVPNAEPDLQGVEDSIVRDIVEAGGVVEVATESERTRYDTALNNLKAIELARKLAGRVARRPRTYLGTSYLAYRSRRRGF